MAEVMILDDDDDDDSHLLVDWRNGVFPAQSSSGIGKATAMPEVVCLDSDSDSDKNEKERPARRRALLRPHVEQPSAKAVPDVSTVTEPSLPPVQAVEAGRGAAATKRRKTCEEIQREQREEKQRKLEEKELRKKEKEERKQQEKEQARIQREAEKSRKAEVKAKAAAARKMEQEKLKWEKGKLALENTAAMIDCKVLESGVIGGQLLNRFAEKGFKFHLGSNPIERSILWKVKRPLQSFGKDSQSLESDTQALQFEDVDAPYVLLVFEAEEFSSLITGDFRKLHDHVNKVQSQHPGFTVCYLVNKLKWYLQKKDQQQYKHGSSNWTKPNADKVLAELLTNYTAVHSRLCVDEPEVAEHIVGLTRSLAECPFKQKLTSLSVSKNGDHVVHGDSNREIIKKNNWLKALVALPKVSGAAAIAISKRYPTFRSLLHAYLDPAMTVHEKELLLEDLEKEAAAGESRRRVGPVCSRRIYRILMAQNGNLKTEDVEAGADQFAD